MIIHYFLEENIFIAIFYKLLVPQKYLKIMLIAFVPENNGKKNPDEYYTSIYQKNIAWSYDYKWASLDDKFSKPFKSYLVEDADYHFINSV